MYEIEAVGIPSTGDTYYGSYRTRTFADIFPKYDEFYNAWSESHFAQILTPDEESDDPGIDPELVWLLLYSRYGNSHIAFSDENQFAYNVFTIMFQYGPTWAKRLQLQKGLRKLSIKDVQKGSTQVYNHASNPSSAPTTQSLTELPYINDQNVSKHNSSEIDAYAKLTALLDTDVSEEFINKFKKLFIKVIAPDNPLLYKTEV